MKLPSEIRRRFREAGRTGGRERARRLDPASRRAAARWAAVRRWTRRRFGAASFAELGLPGGDLVDRGLADLSAGLESVASLLVALAAPRLRYEGVPVPAVDIPEPERKLYRLLSRTEGELAHARYLAYLGRIASFADACRVARRARSRRDA